MAGISPQRAEDESVIGHLYESALDPARWREGLAGLARAAGARSAISFRADVDAGNVCVADQFGQDAAALDAYQAYYHQLDPFVRMSVDAPLGSWMNDWRMLGGQGFERGEWYNDFLRKHDNHAVLGCVVVRKGGLLATVSLQRSVRQGRFFADDEHRLAGFLPHLRQASQLHFATAGLREKADIATAALEHATAAVWVVEAHRAVVLANRRAESLCAPGGPFQVRQGVLHHAAAPAAFAQAVRDATCAGRARAQWAAAAHAATTSLPVLVAPLSATSLYAGAFQRPLAVVMVQPAALGAPGLQELLRTVYGLSVAEAQLACMLAQGCTPAQASDRLKVTIHTVRTQLKAVFAKLGLHRQSELARLLSQLGALARSGE